MAQATLLPDKVQQLLAKRATAVAKRQRIEKLADDIYTLSLPVLMRDIDPVTRSACFVISTEDVDRSGDRVRTAGIFLDNHRANPVVLFDHGRGPIGRQPIGITEDPGGSYTVVLAVDQGVAIARVYFSDKTQFARECWDLVADKVLRGASIAFRLLRADPMPGNSLDDEDASLDCLEVELCELSITPVPDNDRALLVSKAAGGDRPSSEQLARLEKWQKSSADYLPLDPNGKVIDKDGMDTTAGGDGGNLVQPNAADANVQVKPDTGATTMDDNMATDMGDGMGDTGGEMDKAMPDAMPEGKPGSLALTALHDHLSGAGDLIEQHAARQENPAVKDALDETAQKCMECCKALADVHAEQYPDQPPLAGSEDDDTDDDEIARREGENEDQEIEQPDGTKSIKVNRLKFKSISRVRLEDRAKKVGAVRLKRLEASKVKQKAKAAATKPGKIFVTVGAFLDGLAKHEGPLTPEQKTTVGTHAKSLTDLLQRWPPPATPTQAEVDGMKALQDEINKIKAERDTWKTKALAATDAAEKFKKAWQGLKNQA